MTTINPNQEGKPLKPLTQRLEIKEGMTVKEVQEKGNAARKAAATIFDVNGDGSDYHEAYDFSHTRITNDTEKGEIRLYDEKGKKPEKTVNIEAEKQDYAKRTAQRQKFEQTLTNYGLKDKIVNLEWVGIDGCEVETTKEGRQVLILHSKSEGYDLELPIDNNFNPKDINMCRAESEYNIRFVNVNGTLKIYGKGDGSGSGTGDAHGFGFEGTSNVTVVGSDGVADYVEIDDKAQVTFKTKDYADSIYDVTRGEDINLKPGTTTVKSANIE